MVRLCSPYIAVICIWACLLAPVSASPPQGSYFISVTAGDTDKVLSDQVKRNPYARHVKVSLDENVSDLGLHHLSELPDLEWLELIGTAINGAGLTYLKELNKLTRVDLIKCPIIEDNLKCLLCHKIKHLDFTESPVGDRAAWYAAQLPDLEYVNFNVTAATDLTADYMTYLHQLKYLYLLRTKITDKCAEKIAALNNLEVLDVRETAITDVVGKKIGSLPKLRQIYLCGTNITDATVSALVNCPALEVLELHDTKITDACIPSLKKLTRLKNVSLYRTLVTQAAIAKFSKEHPGVFVQGVALKDP